MIPSLLFADIAVVVAGIVVVAIQFWSYGGGGGGLEYGVGGRGKKEREEEDCLRLAGEFELECNDASAPSGLEPLDVKLFSQ